MKQHIDQQGADKESRCSFKRFVVIYLAGAVCFAEQGGTGVGNQHDRHGDDGNRLGEKNGAQNGGRHDVHRTGKLKVAAGAFFTAQGFGKQASEDDPCPLPFFEISVFKQSVADKDEGKQADRNFFANEIDGQRNP